MEMGQEQVDAPRAAGDQLGPERSDTAARVEHDHGSVLERDLDTGGVPAVDDGVAAGRGHRTPTAPDRHMNGHLG